MALEEHLKFAETNGVDTGMKFSDRLIDLIASRPFVLADAINTFSDLRSLVVRVVHAEFAHYSNVDESSGDMESAKMVRLTPRQNQRLRKNSVVMPLTLLLSVTVLLSIWNAAEGNPAIEELVDELLQNDVEDDCGDQGLASAVTVVGEQAAVTVESVRDFR